MNRLLLACLTAVALTGCQGEAVDTAPPPPDVPAPAPLADVNTERLMENISRLASDEFGGRAPMSDGERLTVELIETRWAESGLEPLFGTSYRQPVELVSIEADPTTANLTLMADGAQRPIDYGDDMVVGTRRVVTRSSVEEAELVFVGYGIVAPEYGWNDYEGLDVQGKAVLILVNDPGFATGDARLFNGNKMTYYGRWTYKYEEAARQGAAAAIIIHDTAPAAYGWEVVRNGWAGPQFHLASDNENMDRSPIEGWVRREVAEQMARDSGTTLDDLMNDALSSEFRAVKLHPTFSASVDNTLLRATSYNVGAMISGSDAADELFIYMAHWDHLGTVPTEDSETDSIFNGAVDNATGTAALIELADAFARAPVKPRRSVAFLAVTAEESGLLGSAWYAENPPVPMARTVAGINMDALNPYGPTNDIFIVGYGSSEMEDLLIQAAAVQSRVIKPEAHPERGYYYRSDHFNFAKKGVPMLYAKAGNDHRELGGDYLVERAVEYVETRYHTPADEVKDDWDLRGIVEDIEIYFSIGWKTANSSHWPEWYEGNEFRAIREASRQ